MEAPPADMYEFSVDWTKAFENEDFVKTFASEILERYILKKRWYAGKASTLKYIEIIRHIKLNSKRNHFYGVLIEVNFKEAFFQNYFIPIGFIHHEEIETNTLIAPAKFNKQVGYLVDALHIEDFRKLLFEHIVEKNRTALPNIIFHKSELAGMIKYDTSRFLGAEQSNTSIVFNEKYVLKFFRRIYLNSNPDYEINRFLTEKQQFKNTPAYVGSINILDEEKEVITLGLIQELIPNQGDAWVYFLKEIEQLFKTFDQKKLKLQNLPDTPLYERIKIQQIPAEIIDWVGLNLFLKVEKLALRTAEMHICLGSDSQDTAFTPTHYNGDYSVWLKNRMLYQFQNRLNTIENNLHKLDEATLSMARTFLDSKKIVRKRFVDFDWTALKSERIRVHGDYHLGQVLVTDGDFYILDFEGEPESTIRDRKVKQTPLKDVAGMFRSFHYAIYSVLLTKKEQFKADEKTRFELGERLYRYLIGVFLETYINKVESKNLNIGYQSEILFLLKYFLLEKAVYELGYEMNSRPQWAMIPLKGILRILNHQ